MNTLRVSTFKEQPLQASKWIHIQALLETEEMADLFHSLGHFFLFACGSVTPKSDAIPSHKDFLIHYADYINTLKSGNIPAIAQLQPWFSMVITATIETLFSIPVDETKQVIRVAKPVIQMQAGTISYSPIDQKFRSMVFGSDNILWGIQFSYPHLYQEALTREVITIRNTPEFPNTALFQLLQKWMRQHTIPTPFFVDNTLINVPIRIGKQCLPWVNNHPQLILKGISVK